MSTSNPYQKQPRRAFWKKAVSEDPAILPTEWYRKKWPVSDLRIATAGSCFAQHIGRHLRNTGFAYLDAEPAPPMLKKEDWQRFGYNVYSARYGNVYTPRQMLQLLMRATGEFTPMETVWRKDKGYVDPFRPTLEPSPMSSADEVEHCAQAHLGAVARLFEQTDLFVFTLGLTEAWYALADGAVYPTCPGTQAGHYDAGRHGFINFGYEETHGDLIAFMARARSINPAMRFLLTVSPVPLMATATAHQVVVATTYSKSVLRAVAGRLADEYDYVDYFPSYEIISSHVARARFHEADLRSVTEAGVDHVMKQFFSEHRPPPRATPAEAAQDEAIDIDVLCDEEILATFGARK